MPTRRRTAAFTQEELDAAHTVLFRVAGVVHSPRTPSWVFDLPGDDAPYAWAFEKVDTGPFTSWKRLQAASEAATRLNERRLRKNPSGPDFAVAHGVIEDADNHGEFYEDTVQPRLVAWAKKEAKYLLRGAAWKNRRPVPAVVWNDIVRLWAAEHGAVLTPQQVTSAGTMLRARFEPEAVDYVSHFIDELLYP